MKINRKDLQGIEQTFKYTEQEDSCDTPDKLHRYIKQLEKELYGTPEELERELYATPEQLELDFGDD